MSNIQLNNPETTTGSHRELYEQIEGAFGTTPNMFKAIGNSSAALESMWTSFGALSKGTLGGKLVSRSLFWSLTSIVASTAFLHIIYLERVPVQPKTKWFKPNQGIHPTQELKRHLISPQSLSAIVGK